MIFRFFLTKLSALSKGVFTLLFMLIIINSSVFAQLTGVKTIPGDYATIEAVIAALNTQGVGSGGVTFNVAAGHTETFTTDSSGKINVTGTASDPIIFQKSGAGANPLITASGLGTVASTTTLGSNGDGIIVLVGGDYITFDGIDLQENAGAVGNAKMEYGYYFKKASGDDACKNVIIRNCNITLDMTTIYSFGIFVSNISGTTSVTVTSTGGRSENIELYSNSISNVYGGIQLRGYAASTPYDFYDQNISIGVGGGNSITSYGGGSTTAYGTYSIYQNNLVIANNTVNGTGTSTLYGIMNSTGTNSNLDVYNNNVTITGGGTTSSLYAIYTTMGATGTDNTVSVYNNTIENCTYPTVTSGVWYLLYASSSAMTVNIYGNTIRNNSKAGTGSAYMLYQFNTAAGGSENIYENNIYNNTNGTGIIYALYTNPVSTTIKDIHDNNVYSLTGDGSIYGIYQSTGATVDIYNNSVYDLMSNTISTSSVYGAYSLSGTDVNWYNNFFYDLKAPASTNTIVGTCGMYLSGGTNVNAFYNTVLLDYTSTVATNNSAAVYVGSTAPTTVDMRNNIFVNNVDATISLRAMAFRKGGTALTNLSANNNNNLFYAGTPSVTNIIYYDGTNTAQTMSEFQTLVSPLESASISENPPFLSSTSPYNLHMNTTIATQTESGGTPVTTPIAVTTDFDGDIRNATTPDIGADEFAGIGADLTAPIISYTPLQNTPSTTARSLTSTITDASGVPTSGIGLPVLYWAINGGNWNAATATYLSGDDYQFTFGSGVVLNDVVSYYICAQDNATTPNVGCTPSGGAGGFSANPPAAATPPTTPSSYIITNTALAGDYTVGLTAFNMMTGKNIYFEKVVHKVVKEVDVLVTVPDIQDEKENGIINNLNELPGLPTPMKQLKEVEETTWIPMENGNPYTGDLYVKKIDNPEILFPSEVQGIYATITAAVADLNLRGVSGPVRFLLNDVDYSTGETFPLTIYIENENLPTATNTVTLKPNTGVVSTITCASAINVLGIYDDYIIFDGSNTVGGTTRDLTIVNTYLASTFNIGVVLWNGSGKVATNNTVKNCIIESDPTETSSYGLFLNYAGGGYDNTSFINNKIQNAKIGIQFVGYPSPGLITNNGLISGNIIGDDIKPIKLGGISGSYLDNVMIEGNEIFGEALGNTNTSQYGITLGASTTNAKVQKNNIHDFYYNGTSGYGCFGIRYNSDATSVTEISNNVIYNIKGDGDASSLNYDPAGIYIITGGNINIFYNTIYMLGDVLGQGTTYNGRSTCVSIAAGITLLDVRDNVFKNSMNSFPGSTRINTTYGVYCSSANTAFTDINYNDYFVNGVSPYIGYLGANQTTFAEWQVATGKDVNSISADPLFISDMDLRPAMGSPIVGAGTPIASITTDFLGDTRSATNPSMGAYENAVITPMSGDYTVGLSAFRMHSGLNITFEKRTRVVEFVETVNESELNPEKWENSNLTEVTADGRIIGNEITEQPTKDVVITRTINQEYYVPMLNGHEYTGSLYYELKPEDKTENNSDVVGDYATITDAIADLNLRGVSGPVRFLLVDATYPSETFPLTINTVTGGSSVNTVSILPFTGVTATVMDSLAMPIFNLDGASYIIIDGRQNGVGSTNSLTIMNKSIAANTSCIRFINGATNNAVQYVNLVGMPSTTTARTIDFSTSASDPNGNSNNLITNCDIQCGRYGIYYSGTTANPNMNNVFSNNKIYDGTFANFYMVSAAGNTTIADNEIYDTYGQNNANYGIDMLASACNGVNNITGNKVYDIQDISTSSVRGILVTPNTGSTFNIINNFVSLTLDNGTKTSIYAIQVSGSAENTTNVYYNTINLGGVHTGGSAGTVVSCGLIKSNTGATSTFNAKDNISINTRTGGTSGVVHTNFFTIPTTSVGTLDIDYNVWFASGDPGSYHAGWEGFVYNDQQTYRDSAAPNEQHTIFQNVNFVSGLDLHLAGSSIGDFDLAGLPIAGITTDIDGDTRGTTYPYRGADESSVPLVLVATPTNLVAIADTHKVTLSWNDIATNETGYKIERKDGDSLSVNPFVLIDSVAANSIGYIDLMVVPNTTYTYRIYAYAGQVTSPYSNLAQATTLIPVELTSFTASVSGSEILVNWVTATELNNSGFDLERKMNDTWEKVGSVKGKGTTTEEQHYMFTDKFQYKSFKGTIYYRLKQIDFDGTYHYSNQIDVEVDFTPKEYTLYQNYPNPFNPSTTIKYALPFDSQVKISIYSILGELLDVVVNDVKEVGYHDFNWNAVNYASGVYIYTIQAKSVDGQKSYNSVKKMMLMK